MSQSRGIYIAFGIAGLGIGWLVGLSTSPVIAAVIAALLGATAALAGGTVTSEKPIPALAQIIKPAPLAALIIGIAIGATGGLEFRVTDGFRAWMAPPKGTDLEGIVKQWEALGAKREDVVKRLLDRELPARAATDDSRAISRSVVPSGLVSDALPAGVCSELRAVAPAEIVSTLAKSTDRNVRALADEAEKLKVPESFATRLRDVLCTNH